jgi:pyruvate-formate lyase-activating enzyme
VQVADCVNARTTRDAICTTVMEAAQIHQAMLRIANPDDRGRDSWRRGRARYFNKFRLLKLGFMIRQRYSPLRAANGVLYLLERKRVSRVHYFPVAVAVEAMAGCNLNCPACPTGSAHPLGRKKGKATLESMKSIIDQICRWSLQLSFHHLGEPLLNDDFYAACDYAVAKGLWTVIHSNLSINAENLARRLVSSRLCNLVVSCDGATQAVYEQYRVGGDVELVFRNMRDVAEEKRRRGVRFPWITAQFLVFEHNWHEMKLFRERALSAGADEILFLAGCRNPAFRSGRAAADEVFSLSELSWVPKESPRTCWDLWDSLLITRDGGAFPCCFSYRDVDLFAPPQEPGECTIADYWNGEKYRAMRRFFLGRSTRLKDLPHPCNNCERTLSRRASRPAVGADRHRRP